MISCVRVWAQKCNFLLVKHNNENKFRSSSTDCEIGFTQNRCVLHNISVEGNLSQNILHLCFSRQLLENFIWQQISIRVPHFNTAMYFLFIRDKVLQTKMHTSVFTLSSKCYGWDTAVNSVAFLYFLLFLNFN